MMPPAPSKSYNEFEHESHRISELVWASMAVAPKSRALFLGFENSREVIARALRDGVHITVIEANPNAVREADSLGIEVIRGSSSGIPVRSETFDVAVAHYYLHKADPSFHPQIAFELSRVARRVALIEPGPPADLLGSRIAGLYARAKRDQGQFEQYQGIEYWKKLLTAVRPVVVPLTITYGSLPPRAFLRDAMRMMLDLLRIGGLGPHDLNEMRAIASASDTQMLPQPRYVLLAAASTAEIPHRPRVEDLERQAPNHLPARRAAGPAKAPKLPPEPAPAAATAFVPPSLVEAIAPVSARSALAPSFAIPVIQGSDEPVEHLFRRPKAPPSAKAQWDIEEPAEMPDFGVR
jgi:hypothetical protein